MNVDYSSPTGYPDPPDELPLVAEDYNEQDPDYDHDDEGNRLSCCGEILDDDIMICMRCKEHC